MSPERAVWPLADFGLASGMLTRWNAAIPARRFTVPRRDASRSRKSETPDQPDGGRNGLAIFVLSFRASFQKSEEGQRRAESNGKLHPGKWILTRYNKVRMVVFLGTVVGADGGGRTHTLLRVPDFESSASANSATSATMVANRHQQRNAFCTKKGRWQEHSSSLPSSRRGGPGAESKTAHRDNPA